MSVPAPSAVRREPVVLRVRAHARRLVLPALLIIVGAAAAGYWGGALPEPWMNVAVWLGFAALVLWGVAAWVGWLMRRTVVTPSRLIMHRGVLVQHRSDLPYSQVREVRTRRSLLQQMFGSGNVVLITGGPSPTVLRDVPNSDQVCDALRELIERHYVASLDAASPQGTVRPPHSGVGAGAGAGGAGTGFAPERASTWSGASASDTVRVTDTPHPGFSDGRFTRAH